MAIVKKKSRSYPQISLNPFSLFVISSVAIHGLVLWGFTFNERSRLPEEEATPIDFVIVPPEETSTEPPSNTERQAAENSVAQGDVNPELPTASEKIDSQEAIATPASPTVQTEQAPPVVPPTPPQPQAKPTPPPAPPKAIAETAPPKEVKPNPPVVKEPKPVTPQPSAQKPESVVTPPVTEPEPVAETPLLSGEDTSSLPKETPATATENPFQTDLPSKSEVREALPQQETPAEATETLQPDLPPLPEPALPPTETPPTKTDPEPVSPVATNVPPEPVPTEPTPPENTSVPETPSESTTAVASGSASLLEGTQARSSEDSDSTFFAPETNASQQATNTSGVDARANVDLGPYYAEVRRRVKQHWLPHATGNNRHTVLAFSIGRNGQIIGLRVRQSSGSPEVDQKSLDAVQKSGPFAPLPANYPNPQLDVEFNFNIYVEQG